MLPELVAKLYTRNMVPASEPEKSHANKGVPFTGVDTLDVASFTKKDTSVPVLLPGNTVTGDCSQLPSTSSMSDNSASQTSASSVKLWCFCQTSDKGSKMIECESGNCEIWWFM